MSESSELQLYKEKLALLEKKKDLIEGLPHLYAHKIYKWQRDFINERNHCCFLTAASQIGKSTSQIMKCITWATSPDLWPELWSAQWDALKSDKIRLFWYLYPDGGTATIEFETKWSKYLPSGKYKNHPIYGWKAEYRSGNIESITFNSGVMVVFKFYSQKAMNIQAQTVYACYVDEEIPYELYSEVTSRLNATEGYFSMVFTATLGQEEWRRTMEEKGEKELFSEAWKRQISLYDCMEYEDGSPSGWTERRITRVINSYPTRAEVEARVFGKFGVTEGRVYESFDPSVNIIQPIDIGKDYYIYGGIDIGSGGKNHPSALVLIAVRNDFRKGYVFRGWRGDNVITTNRDVVDKYMELIKGLNPLATYYDWHAKDFGMIGISVIPGLQPAEKSHDIGEGILNVLFKNKKLMIFDTPELQPLRNELTSLKVDTPKNKAHDDFCFTKGNNVATPKGFVDISEINIGDEVITRKGPRKVTAILKRDNVEVSYYKFREGVQFIGTPDHRFINRENKKVKLKDIKSWCELQYLCELEQFRLLYYFNMIDFSVDLSLLVPENYSKTWSDTVYGLTVEGEHEYYVNGVLVSNCDALRYGISKIPWNYDDIDDNVILNTTTVKVKTDVEKRRDAFVNQPSVKESIDREMEEWNELY